jgi:magnesium-transporting ATPase (P-type)
MRETDLDVMRDELREMPGEALKWHAISEEDVFNKLQTAHDGISSDQVNERLAAFGRNILPSRPPVTLIQVILHQFKSPLIYILLIAGGIALALDDLEDAIFIFIVILLNATIGTIQEWQAEQSAQSLQDLIQVQARVRRQGRQTQIAAEEIVPGDVVLMESGDKVPADLRLIQAINLSIDESFLTGESMAAQKRRGVLEEDLLVSDRTNIAYAGSTITAGRGVGLVIATGRYTEVGKIASTMSEDVGAKPPLVIRMERFAKQISVIVLIFASLLGLISFLQGMPITEVIFLVVALAVSAIPEGLPVAMTVALSLATRRMAKRHVIVRRLAAVESLGSCTAIASDKTGTLTVNQQTVKLIAFPGGSRYPVSGHGYNDQGSVETEDGSPLPEDTHERIHRLARASVLVNEASLHHEDGQWVHTGDAVDVALLALGHKVGLNSADLQRENETVAEIPFESERRYAAMFYQDGNGVNAVSKGAVEAVLPFCDQMLTREGPVPIDREGINQQGQRMAAEGFRVLAVAEGQGLHVNGSSGLDETHLTSLTLLGLIGFIDPLRPEVREAVEDAHKAGIRVLMITGDHPDTALAIASELDIAHSRNDVCTGQQLASIGSYDVPGFYEQVKRTSVFARVTPDQKLHIVDALIKQGEFVAVTGDGVNDAPALQKANIGVAMGSGTDIAKDTASMIVTDDNFASIVAGVEEGRFAYSNVRKVTLLLISTGAAELVLITLAVLFGLPIPLLAVQILWINLVTNGIQDVALAFEAGEKGVMRLPPRKPSEGIFNRKMIEQVVISGLTMALICFAAWLYMLNQGWDETTARTALLTLLVLMQSYHVFNSRSEYLSAFRVPLRNNRVLVFGALAALGLHVLATEVPFLQSLLEIDSLPIQMWAILAVVASSVLIVMEIYKRLSKDRQVIEG